MDVRKHLPCAAFFSADVDVDTYKVVSILSLAPFLLGFIMSAIATSDTEELPALKTRSVMSYQKKYLL